jgi:hypothetical protein
MQARHIEIVRVASPGFFVDAAHQACRHDGALDNGYYLALGSRRPARSGSDADLRLYGPFATEAEARLLAVSARALGLTENRTGRRLRPPAKSRRLRQHDRGGETSAPRGSNRSGSDLRDGRSP